MRETPRVLLVDGVPGRTIELLESMRAESFLVETATGVSAATTRLRRESPDVLITQASLPDGSGVDLLAEAEGTCVKIVLVDDIAVSDIVEAVKAGAVDVLENPVFPGHFLSIIGQALAARRRDKEPAPKALDIDLLARPPIIGDSAAIKDVLDSLEPIKKAPRTSVLIEGESGTGKELFARAVHYDGPRRARPFLAINCATLTENLLEAELFGYEKGAFTGASTNGKRGLFEAASGGTLFLDEIGELAPALQAKLLRVLQEGTFKRVGGLVDISVDVRVIAATNRDLGREVSEGRFRTDLFYRLNVVPIRVPPLRDRMDDIPILCQYFVQKFSEELGKVIDGIAAAAIDDLRAYHWPGNVRQLRNVCEYAAIVCDSTIIESRHLSIPDDGVAPEPRDSLPLHDRSLRGMESELIRMVLSETRFNISRAASILGINRSTLYNKMRDYGLRRSERPKLRQTV